MKLTGSGRRTVRVAEENLVWSQALWHVYGIPALKMQRQEDHHKFNASVVCIVSSKSMSDCPPQIKTNMVVATHNHK